MGAANGNDQNDDRKLNEWQIKVRFMCRRVQKFIAL